MGLYYSLIKTKNGERYNLWGRSGGKYAPDFVCHGLADHDPPVEPFWFSDLYTREELLTRVEEEVINHTELGREFAEILVDDLLKWVGGDEVIIVSDHYYEYLDKDEESGCYINTDGKLIIATGSGYSDDRRRFNEALDAILENTEELK
jgi:hypothetical protein